MSLRFVTRIWFYGYILLSGFLLACSQCDELAIKFINDIEYKCGQLSPGQELRIVDINKGDWDRMYIFHPYTSIKNIESLVEIKYTNAIAKTQINMRDDINLFVFVKGKTIQLVAPVPRAVIDVPMDIDVKQIQRNAAIFTYQGKGLPIILANNK